MAYSSMPGPIRMGTATITTRTVTVTITVATVAVVVTVGVVHVVIIIRDRRARPKWLEAGRGLANPWLLKRSSWKKKQFPGIELSTRNGKRAASRKKKKLPGVPF